jgi:hypothetical protein
LARLLALPINLMSRRLRSISGRSRKVIVIKLDQIEGEQHRLMAPAFALQCMDVRRARSLESRASHFRCQHRRLVRVR